ncbi:MAG: NAD(P)/FAD-dependent oxidoreductase [Polyangiaceae bacterium]|nr:NAD(P)/FAD-dependent oxidoreductase [Polyangiaceae bacterium]
MARDPEIIVVGASLDGLAAACTLARRGHRVLVLEEDPRRPGAGAGTSSPLRAGFLHDDGPTFFPLALLRGITALRLERHGLDWCRAEVECVHLLSGDEAAVLAADEQRTARSLGAADEPRWRALLAWYRSVEEPLLDALLAPGLDVRRLSRLGVSDAWRALRRFGGTGGGLARPALEGATGGRLVAQLGLGRDGRARPGRGLALALAVATRGVATPRGGVISLVNALVTCLEAQGGRLHLGARVEELLTEGRRAVGVRLVDRDELRASCAILVEQRRAASLLSAPAAPSAHRLPAASDQSSRRPGRARRLDWSLAYGVPWQHDAARESALVHLATPDAAAAPGAPGRGLSSQAEAGSLVLAQASGVDDLRAPAGFHTLWGYHVHPEGGGEEPRGDDELAAWLEARIEAFAPGFRQAILERRVTSPPPRDPGDPAGGTRVGFGLVGGAPPRRSVAGLYTYAVPDGDGLAAHGESGCLAAAAVSRDARGR